MSSTVQATSSTSSTFITQLITDALVDYTKKTGIDLLRDPSVIAIRRANTPGDIIALFKLRAEAFQAYREGNGGLIRCLRPVATFIQNFSGILREVVGLVPFPPAKVLFVAIDVLLAAATRVTSSYDALINLFEHSGTFLMRLEVYATITPPPIMMMDLLTKIMVTLLSVLALATKDIKQGRVVKFSKRLLGNKTDKSQAALERLDRLTKDEGLSVAAQTLNDMNKMKRDQLQRDFQQWLSPPDPSTNHNFVSKLRHKGTTAWFFESSALKEWKANGSLLWIHGKPGAGKSTLLSAIIQDVKGMHAAGLATMAYYYFDFRDSKKQHCRGLLSSLVSQLSAQSDSCCNVLSKSHSDNSRGMQKPEFHALKKCLADMLSLPGQGRIYIIVDALDECPNSAGTPSDREDVLDFVKEVVNMKLPNVNLCVASRPEIDIQSVLEPLTTLKICLHDEIGQKNDIVEYINSIVRSDERMRRWNEEDKQLVVDTLSSKADGMFRWTVCQVDTLRRTLPSSIRKVLNDLPKTLDETYSRTLLDIDEENREHAQRLFRCLVVSIRPLRVEELAEILAIKFDEGALPTFNTNWRPVYAEESIMSVCSSLIAIVDRGGDRVVQFSHFSVKEYLTSKRLASAKKRLSYYHILPEPAHTTFAHVSLSVLLHLDDEIDRDTIAHTPLAPYAARYWVDHAQFRNVSLQIKKLMERLYDPARTHFAAWVWVYDIDRYWMEHMPTVHPTPPEAGPLYYASLCGFVGLAEHLIATHSQDVNSKGGFHTTALHAASAKGHTEIASLLLRNDADPDSRDHLGRVPLHRVSQGGQLVMAKSPSETARLLVDFGADVNVPDKKGCAPLHAAAQSGYREIAELLLGSGASLDARNEKQETPLGLSCEYGNHDMARFLIDRGSDVNSRDKTGFIPLHAASLRGHVDVARLLLDRGSDVNGNVQEYHQTPLFLSSQNGHLDLTRLLIDRGANVNIQSEEHFTALHQASGGGHFDIAKLLIDHGANVNSLGRNNWTPLFLASSLGHLDIARLLIEKGGLEALFTPDKQGQTPFHNAAYFGHLPVTKFLLECGIDIDIRNGEERTPVHLASRTGKLDVVRFLIDQGANIIIAENSNTPLHIASKNGHFDVVQLIINTGTPVDVRNETQKTPLALASGEGKVEIARFLIDRGANLNVRDNMGQAPLHLASQNGYPDTARLLLDHGVDPNIKSIDRWTPLHLASANRHFKNAELLVQRGAIVDLYNDQRKTPLYLAAENGNTMVARLLIDHGATMHTADSDGMAPLHVASRRGHLGVIKLLLRRGADVDVLNRAGRSAAELASRYGHAEVAEFISEYKANAEIRRRIRSPTLDTVEFCADDNGKTWAEGFLHACAEEWDADTVDLLLERRADINLRNASDETPLEKAAAKGNVETMRLLIKRGAEVDSRDKWGWTPLHQSSRYGQLEASRVLLDHGANVNARSLDYWTPMHSSAANGHLKTVKLLLERGADIHAMNADGETPYQVSFHSRYREISDLLHG